MSFLLLPDVLTIEKQRQQKPLTKLMHFRLRTVFLFLQIKRRETRETPSVTRALLDGFRKKKECVLSKCISIAQYTKPRICMLWALEESTLQSD